MDYTIRYTIAPEQYDGFGTRTLAIMGTYDRKLLRQVAIETQHLDWQEYRYSSGMHRSFTPEQFAEIQTMCWYIPLVREARDDGT